MMENESLRQLANQVHLEYDYLYSEGRLDVNSEVQPSQSWNDN